jgi:hypothetical protein
VLVDTQAARKFVNATMVAAATGAVTAAPRRLTTKSALNGTNL